MSSSFFFVFNGFLISLSSSFFFFFFMHRISFNQLAVVTALTSMLGITLFLNFGLDLDNYWVWPQVSSFISPSHLSFSYIFIHLPFSPYIFSVLYLLNVFFFDVTHIFMFAKARNWRAIVTLIKRGKRMPQSSSFRVSKSSCILFIFIFIFIFKLLHYTSVYIFIFL